MKRPREKGDKYKSVAKFQISVPLYSLGNSTYFRTISNANKGTSLLKNKLKRITLRAKKEISPAQKGKEKKESISDCVE